MAKTAEKITTITTVNPTQLKTMIDHCSRRKRPIFVSGPPGMTGREG